MISKFRSKQDSQLWFSKQNTEKQKLTYVMLKLWSSDISQKFFHPFSFLNLLWCNAQRKFTLLEVKPFSCCCCCCFLLSHLRCLSFCLTFCLCHSKTFHYHFTNDTYDIVDCNVLHSRHRYTRIEKKVRDSTTHILTHTPTHVYNLFFSP